MPERRPASFPHLHCPQEQVCAAAELQRGRRLACSSTPSATGLDAGWKRIILAVIYWRGSIVRPNARAWRARVEKSTVGSNPTLSAIVLRKS